MLTYSLTKDNLIDDCSDDWDAEAAANGGRQLRCSSVVGHNILSFVSGLETRSYLNALFFVCRQTQKAIDVGYRCNWHRGTQLFRMEVRSLGDGGLEIGHRPVAPPLAAPEGVNVLNDRRPTCQCSQCLRVLVGNTWVDVFRRLPVMDFDVRAVVCPSCRKAAIGMIERFPLPPEPGA